MCRPSGDLDASLAGLPPSLLGPRRDSVGAQPAASRPDGSSAADASRNGDADSDNADGGGGGSGGGIAGTAQQRAPFGQVASPAGQVTLSTTAEETPSTSRSAAGQDGWRAEDVARKGAASSAAAAFEKENAQPNGLVSAAAFLRASHNPGESARSGNNNFGLK